MKTKSSSRKIKGFFRLLILIWLIQHKHFLYAPTADRIVVDFEHKINGDTFLKNPKQLFFRTLRHDRISIKDPDKYVLDNVYLFDVDIYIYNTDPLKKSELTIRNSRLDEVRIIEKYPNNSDKEDPGNTDIYISGSTIINSAFESSRKKRIFFNSNKIHRSYFYASMSDIEIHNSICLHCEFWYKNANFDTTGSLISNQYHASIVGLPADIEQMIYGLGYALTHYISIR